METNAKQNLQNKDNIGDMTRQSGAAMALSQSQWKIIRQSNIPPNLPFHHQISQTSGDTNVFSGAVDSTSGDAKGTSGDDQRKSGDQSGDQSGDFQEKIENKQQALMPDNDDYTDWAFQSLPDLSSLSRDELLQYRKSLKQRKTHLKIQAQSNENNKQQHQAQLRVIEEELEKLFHLLKWRPTSQTILIRMSDEELKRRQEELNSVRLNPTNSVTDHARVNGQDPVPAREEIKAERA